MSAKKNNKKQESKTVLLVSEDRLLLSLLRHSLIDMGYNVNGVSSPLELMGPRKSYDLAVIDDQYNGAHWKEAYDAFSHEAKRSIVYAGNPKTIEEANKLGIECHFRNKNLAQILKETA